MNPKIRISVDAKNRAISSLVGIVSVGAKVDIEVDGLPSDIPDWDQADRFSGKSLRLRIVDECGRDIARYPLREKTVTPASLGDTWTVSQAGNVYSTSSGCFLECDTDAMRRAFRNVSFDDFREFGVILDSIVDDAEYAVGRVRVRQWAVASSEDPTILPDWRETLAELRSDLGSVDAAKDSAQASASAASASAASASSSASSAQSNASASLSYMSGAIAARNEANEQRILAQSAKNSAEAAKLSAEVAITHYPKIGENGNWFVWNATLGEWEDTLHPANGGHNIFKGKVFQRPTTARGWYELLAHMLVEMGGNIDMDGITPGTAPQYVTMTADDNTSRMVKVVKSGSEYTTEVV